MARTRPLKRAGGRACVPAVYLVDCGWLILASADIFSCLDTGVRGSLREASEAKREERG